MIGSFCGPWVRKRGVSEDWKAFGLRPWEDRGGVFRNEAAGGAGSHRAEKKFSFLPGALELLIRHVEPQLDIQP